jgi:hypothetical protein
MRQNMSFYCVYCNRDRSGKRNSLEEKTNEHFIPDSIGGKWIIPACNQCNNIAGKGCDSFLKNVAYTYKLFLNGIVEINGVAELNDNRLIPSRLKYQTTVNGHHQFFECKDLSFNGAINKDQLKSFLFQVQDPNSIQYSYPGIAKIALGSIFYLTKSYKMCPSKISNIFRDLTFADIRSLFLGSYFNPGGKGHGHGAIMVSLSPSQAERLLLSRNSPNIRRHYISVEDANNSIVITLCLYSMYFWKVTIPNAALSLGKLEDEILLKKLDPVNPAKAAALMHQNGKTWIKLIPS